MIALLALLGAARAEAPAPLSAELRQLLSARATPDLRSPEQARLLARSEVRVVVAAADGLDLRGLGTWRASLGRWRSADVTWDALEILARNPLVQRIELGPSLGMKPPVDHSAGLIGVDELRSRIGTPLDGSGVLVVDFDTGVDLDASQFLRADGGLHPFVDQDGDGELTPDVDTVVVDGDPVVVGIVDATVLTAQESDETVSFGYRRGRVDTDVDVLFADLDGDGRLDGREPRYLAEDLDGSGGLEVGEELVGLSTTKVAATWDAGRGLTTRAQGLDGTSADHFGHGVSVASVLLGGHPGLGRWTGHAPGAELAAFNYYENYDQFDWVTAIDAALGLDPDVMLYEVGDYYAQFADGSSAFEEALVAAADQGAVQVCPAGNIGAYGKHGQHSVPAAGEWAGLYVYSPAEGYEVAYVGVTIVTQDGPFQSLTFQHGDTGEEVTIPIDGNAQLGQFQFRATSDRSSRGTNMVVLEWFTNSGTISGPHYLYIDPQNASEVHTWLADDDSSWAGGAVNMDPGWGWGDSFSWAAAESSAVVPSTSDACITLASFQARADVYGGDEDPVVDGELSYFSGRGPRIDGADVVDVAAPGNYDIRALGTSELLAPNSWTLFGGTSAAGPHVAAAAAILRQAAPGLSHDAAEQALTDAADHSAVGVGGNYDHAWGFGRLQIPNAAVAVDTTPPTFRVLRSTSPFAPLHRFRVVVDEPLDGSPSCATSAGPVTLRSVGAGTWQGHSTADDLSCEGEDLNGNAGTSTVLRDP